MIDVYTWTTGNGRKVPIFLEETGTPYRLHMVDIHNGEQHKPEFVRLNPNRKIPAITDQDGPGGSRSRCSSRARSSSISPTRSGSSSRRTPPAATTPSSG